MSAPVLSVAQALRRDLLDVALLHCDDPRDAVHVAALMACFVLSGSVTPESERGVHADGQEMPVAAANTMKIADSGRVIEEVANFIARFGGITGLTNKDIASACGLSVKQVSPALTRLKASGRIVTTWEAGVRTILPHEGASVSAAPSPPDSDCTVEAEENRPPAPVPPADMVAAKKTGGAGFNAFSFKRKSGATKDVSADMRRQIDERVAAKMVTPCPTVVVEPSSNERGVFG